MSTHFSIITPSAGRRPKALQLAMDSVGVALARASMAGLDCRVEMLVGFDGVRPDSFFAPPFVRHVVLPREGEFGNVVRDRLLRTAGGERVLFLDDDNALTPDAFLILLRHMAPDLVLARIDTSRAFAEPYLPRDLPGGERVAQGNIDPLCLSVRTEFARVRGRGWTNDGGYESDYLNILRYYRRAKGVVFVDEIIGVYDAGRGLDDAGLNMRQTRTRELLASGASLPSAAPWRDHG